MTKKVLLITNILPPYRIPLFNEMDRQLKEKGIEFKVVSAASGYKRRKFILDISEIRFSYEILKSQVFTLGDVEKTIFSYSGLGKVLSVFNPDKIIVSGFSFATLRLWMRSYFKKTDYIIWSGTVEFAGRYDSVLRRFLRKRFIKRAASFVTYGTKAKEYLVKMGADASRVHIGINTVDTTFFTEETARLRSGSVHPGKTRFIYVGYLVPRKNVAKLIGIMEELSKTRNDFVLDILGDGSSRPELERLVKGKNLSGHVLFHGFIQKEKLPAYFANSACFLFQTDFDIWGLVLNEAMSAGLPVLSSVNAGATIDLVVDGKTGFAVDYNNNQQIVNILIDLLDNPGRYRQIGDQATRFVNEKASIFASAAGFINSVTGKKAADCP